MATALTPRKKRFLPRASTSSENEKQNIKIMVRMRPVSKLEEKIPTPLISFVSPKEIMIRNKRFHFDRVFKPETDQLEVYQSLIAAMIPDLIAGYECTVFAYGETGSGKTYTVSGENCRCPINWKTDLRAGFIPRAAAHIFEALRKARHEHSVKVSYLEIYNEEIHDLLCDDESLLSIYDVGERSIFIQGIKEVAVTNGKELCKQLEKGNLKRLTAPTLMDHQSAQSHTVFAVTVHTREVSVSGHDILKAGKLKFVDLAGSENMARSGCEDPKAVELATINKSLLTFGRVINALVEKEQTYVPYRESILTRILKDSLGGHTKTCIIATICTSSEETMNTLEYASRARRIKNTPKISEKLTKDQMVKGLHKEILRLQKDIDAARDNTGFFVNEENYQRMIDTMEIFTGEKMTMEEITSEQAKRIEELEEIVEIKTKEFEENASICQKSKKLLKKAKWIVRKKEATLKQEQYISQTYEAEASQLHKQAKQLLSTTKQLSEETGILQEKLKTEHGITLENQNITQGVVAQITGMLNEILEESDIVQFRDESIRTLFKEDINHLKSQLLHPLEELKKALALFHALSSEELSIRDKSRISIYNNIDSIREETLDMKAKLSSHLSKLKEFKAENKGTIAENFEIMSSDYSHSIYGLSEIIYKQLTAEDASLKENIVELKRDVVAAQRETYLMSREQVELEITIMNEIDEIQDMISQRESRNMREQFLGNVTIMSNEKTDRFEAVAGNMETTLNEITTDPTKSAHRKTLTTLQVFNTDMDSLAARSVARSVESQHQTELAKASLIHDMEKIIDTFNEKINTVEDGFDSLVDSRVSFHKTLESSALETSKVLKEDFIDQSALLMSEGSQGLEVTANVLEPPSLREQVIKRFEAHVALNDNESTSTSESELDLEDPEYHGDSEEPGTSNQP